MNNIEIERKYKVTEEIYIKILQNLSSTNQNKKIEHQNDIYFSPIHFPFFGGEIDNECLRLRILANKNILSYKKFIPATSKEPAHCIEHELEITDVEKIKLILKDLRIEEAFTLKKERTIFIINNLEVALDKVADLGYFLEVELLNQENISETITEIEKFLQKYKIMEDMRNYDGYSYLLYNKNNK